MMNNICFPIVIVKGVNLMRHNSLNEFRKTSVEILNSGFFKKILIFDSCGNKLKVSSTTESESAGLIGKWHPLKKGKQIYFDFETNLLSDNNDSLDELKKIIIKSLSRVDYTSSGINENDLIEEINKTFTEM